MGQSWRPEDELRYHAIKIDWEDDGWTIDKEMLRESSYGTLDLEDVQWRMRKLIEIKREGL